MAALVKLHVLLVSAAGAVWIYSWPYGSDNNCKCQERAVGSYISFESAEACLESFALEENEYCAYEGEGGISLHDCDNVVSYQEGITDQDCFTLCTEVVADLANFQSFKKVCGLEFVTVFDDSAIPEQNSCFSNYVYGWADYNESNPIQSPPLKVFYDVDTPAQCQSLCQLTPQCQEFNWKGLPDDATEYDSEFASNPPLTCILYDARYMQGVFSVVVDQSLRELGGNEFCDVQSLNTNCRPISDTTFNPFDTEFCLLCGCQAKCAWKDKRHVTGPAFCTRPPTDVCQPVKPIWTTSTSTTPTYPTCPPTETCATPSQQSTSAGTTISFSTTASPAPASTCPPVDCCPPCPEESCCESDEEDCCDVDDPDCF